MQQFLENGEGVTNPLEHMVEDKINTLLTGDPNKEKVYSEGYDGHCFRTYYYWKDQMPDIVDTVESINSIADKYPDLRSKSKAPTFA